MDKQRKLKRRHLIFYLRVFDAKTGNLIGHLADLSPDGILLVSDKPIESEQEFHLKIKLPESAGSNKFMEFKAKSKWCNNDVNPDIYDIGFQIFGVGPSALEHLAAIVKRFGFHD
jgi:hypothetical protein